MTLGCSHIFLRSNHPGASDFSDFAKEYLAAAVDYVRFHALMLDFKAACTFLNKIWRL
jgi:hypothetical protein